MSAVWVIAKIIKNPSIIDSFWALGLMSAGLIYLWPHYASSRYQIIMLLLCIWGFRLAFYLLFTRIFKREVDKRYLQLSKTWRNYFLNFQFQGLLIFLVSACFYFVAHSGHDVITFIDLIAVMFCLVGIIGECLADVQLYEHKKSGSKTVCNTGLWATSRHPNLFFDCMTWFGFAFFALGSSWGCLALLSPLVLYIVMTRVTIPITERASIKSRGEAYVNYQKTTPMFVPDFSKSGR